MSEYPWFTKHVAKYWPEIEAGLDPDEEVVYKFMSVFEGLGSRVSGLVVLSNKNILVRGKPKAGAFTAIWKIAGAKKYQEFPLASIYEVIDKKKGFICRIHLDFKGEKYVGKDGKFLLKPHQGKEKGLGKEPKAEWLKRIQDYQNYIMSKMGT